MALFLAIFALENTWGQVCFSNHSDRVADIKAPLNQIFSFNSTLHIPNINPDNYYIGFQ